MKSFFLILLFVNFLYSEIFFIKFNLSEDRTFIEKKYNINYKNIIIKDKIYSYDINNSIVENIKEKDIDKIDYIEKNKVLKIKKNVVDFSTIEFNNYSNWHIDNQGGFSATLIIDGEETLINSIENADTELKDFWELNPEITGTGIKIGVFDSEFDLDNNIGFNIKAAFDIDESDNNTTINNNTIEPHGTNVLSLISAPNDDNQVLGTSFNSDIYLIKNNTYTLESLLLSLNTLENWGVDIINFSWGFESTEEEPAVFLEKIEQMIETGRNGKGIIFVVASGNEDTNIDDFQMYKIPNLITVGSSFIDGKRFYYSNYGSELDVLAPANVVSFGALYSESGSTVEEQFFAGTSASAPIVSGIISNILQKYNWLTASDIETFLNLSSSKDGDEEYINGRNDYYGYGNIKILSLSNKINDFINSNTAPNFTLDKTNVNIAKDSELNINIMNISDNEQNIEDIVYTIESNNTSVCNFSNIEGSSNLKTFYIYGNKPGIAELNVTANDGQIANNTTTKTILCNVSNVNNMPPEFNYSSPTTVSTGENFQIIIKDIKDETTPNENIIITTDTNENCNVLSISNIENNESTIEIATTNSGNCEANVYLNDGELQNNIYGELITINLTNNKPSFDFTPTSLVVNQEKKVIIENIQDENTNISSMDIFVTTDNNCEYVSHTVNSENNTSEVILKGLVSPECNISISINDNKNNNNEEIKNYTLNVLNTYPILNIEKETYNFPVKSTNYVQISKIIDNTLTDNNFSNIQIQYNTSDISLCEVISIDNNNSDVRELEIITKKTGECNLTIQAEEINQNVNNFSSIKNIPILITNTPPNFNLIKDFNSTESGEIVSYKITDITDLENENIFNEITINYNNNSTEECNISNIIQSTDYWEVIINTLKKGQCNIDIILDDNEDNNNTNSKNILFDILNSQPTFKMSSNIELEKNNSNIVFIEDIQDFETLKDDLDFNITINNINNCSVYINDTENKNDFLEGNLSLLKNNNEGKYFYLFGENRGNCELKMNIIDEEGLKTEKKLNFNIINTSPDFSIIENVDIELGKEKLIEINNIFDINNDDLIINIYNSNKDICKVSSIYDIDENNKKFYINAIGTGNCVINISISDSQPLNSVKTRTLYVNNLLPQSNNTPPNFNIDYNDTFQANEDIYLYLNNITDAENIDIENVIEFSAITNNIDICQVQNVNKNYVKILGKNSGECIITIIGDDKENINNTEIKSIKILLENSSPNFEVQNIDNFEIMNKNSKTIEINNINDYETQNSELLLNITTTTSNICKITNIDKNFEYNKTTFDIQGITKGECKINIILNDLGEKNNLKEKTLNFSITNKNPYFNILEDTKNEYIIGNKITLYFQNISDDLSELDNISNEVIIENNQICQLNSINTSNANNREVIIDLIKTGYCNLIFKLNDNENMNNITNKTFNFYIEEKETIEDNSTNNIEDNSTNNIEDNLTNGFYIKNNKINFELNLKKGWNLISFPSVESKKINDIYKNCTSLSYVFKWDNEFSNWRIWDKRKVLNELNNLIIGNGYWFYLRDNDCKLKFEDIFYNDNAPLISKGWNLVGLPDNIDIQSEIINENFSHLFEYDNLNNKWKINKIGKNDIENISPIKGYWIHKY